VLSNGDVLGLGDSVTLTYYEVGVAAEVAETLVGHTGGSTAQVDAAQEPAEAPAPQPYVPPGPPSPTTPPPTPLGDLPEERGKGGVSWVLIGCVSLVLLVILACVVVVALDAFRVLPDFFYEPIRWLGLESYFTG
jgi:hypothetical protein